MGSYYSKERIAEILVLRGRNAPNICNGTTGMVGNRVFQSCFVGASGEMSGQMQASFSEGELARTWQRPVGQRSPGAVLARSAQLS